MLIQKVKKEFVNLMILYLALIILFKILFVNESLRMIIRLISSLFWLFILPGFYFMYFWHKDLDFLERLIIGMICGIAIVTTFSYNFGVFGLTTKMAGIIFPILTLTAFGIYLYKDTKGIKNE